MSARFIQYVNAPIWPRTIGNEQVAQPHRGQQRVIRDSDTMMALQPFPARLQHAHRLLNVELAHHDPLEPAFESRIAADPPIVLVVGRCSDDAEVAANQCGLEHVRRIHRRSHRAALSNEIMQFIDEQDDVRIVGSLRYQRAQPLLVLAPEHRPGQQRNVIEGEQPGVA